MRQDACWQKSTISTICYLYSTLGYKDLANVSADINSLEICVDNFYADQLNLDNITDLKQLSFYPLRKNPMAHFAFSNSSKHPLASLKMLGIHIHLNGIDTTLFKQLGQLKILDLSEVQGLPAHNIISVLAALNSAGAPLEELYLHSAHNQTSKGDILKLRDILTNLEGFPLKVLDLRRITNLEFGGGFAQFTPGLEKLCFGWHRNIIMKDWDEKCVWLDISILPELKYLHFELGPWPGIRQTMPCSDSWADVTLLSKILSHGKTLTNCSKFVGDDNCSCQCFAKIHHDKLLIAYVGSLKYEKVNYTVFPPFPMGLKLEHLRISGTQMQAKQGTLKVVQHDTALKYLEYLNYHLPNDPPPLSQGNAQSGLTKLTYLDLRNSIGDIMSASSIWRNMSDLLSLHLWFNKYTESHSGTDIFGGIPNLRTLDLRYCNASSVPNVTSLTKLTKIDLRFNELKHLPKHLTSILDKLTVNNITVDLSGNTLSCHCNDRWLINWMKNTKVHFDNSDKLRCEYPGNRYDVNPLEIDLVGLSIRCSNFRHILIAVFSTLGSICILFIVILTVLKRWTIRYWLHAARTSWNQKQGSNMHDHHNYRYDAFVAYCSRDEEERKWVHLKLTPKLEEEYGFKLCLHHRDFMPGYDIADNIVQAIQDSSKVVLILSPTFLESDWCQFEVRMAREKLVQDRRDSLVLVIYKPLDVPGVRLPRKLIRILEKKTYVEWTMDGVGQNLFWEKLSRALKDEIRHDPYRDLARTERSNNDDRDLELQPLLT